MPLCLLGICRRRGLSRVSFHENGTVPLALAWVPDGPLAAAALRPAPASFGPLDHARLLAAIHGQLTVLPMRYGAVLPDEEAVRRFLGNRREKLLADLDRLAGAAEIGLRIELPQNPLPGEPLAASGSNHSHISPAGYLAARRARYQWHDQLAAQAQHAAAACVESLDGLYRSWRRLSPEPPGFVRLAFLVERTLSAAFAQRVEKFRATQPGRQCKLVGPWPPYSFVGDEGRQAAN
jgi:hypothetical protein